MIGIVRVLTTDDPEVLAAHGRQIEARYGVSTRTLCIPSQPEGIHDEATEREAIPKVLDTVKRLASDGAQAVIISCAADPGLDRARALVTVPVIGAGSAAAAVALALGGKVAALNLNGLTPRAVREVLGSRLVGEAAATSPDGNARDLLRPSGQETAARVAEELMARTGADVLVLACTGYATIGLADRLRERLGRPVVDPVDAAGAVAVAASSRW